MGDSPSGCKESDMTEQVSTQPRSGVLTLQCCTLQSLWKLKKFQRAAKIENQESGVP